MHEFDQSCLKPILSLQSIAQNNRHLYSIITTILTILGTELVTLYIKGSRQRHAQKYMNYTKLHINTKENNNYLFSIIPSKQAIYCAVQERQDKRQRSFSTLLPQVIPLIPFHFSADHVILPLRTQATLGIYAKTDIKNDIKVFKLVPSDNVTANALSKFMLREISMGIFFIYNLSLQQNILHDIIVYMALNKTFNVFHVSIKVIPRKAKHFIRWNPLSYQPDLRQIVNTKNLSIRYSALQAGIIFMQKFISHSTLSKIALYRS